VAKRALLIGVNKYKIPGADLRGCVNDVNNMQSALIDLFGFKKGDITVLTDLDATKQAMMAGIKQIIKDSRPGDVAVIHYSGHGSNVPDDNGDEPDGRDEILCPTDLNWDDTLRDDWLRTELDKVKAGVHLTLIMDCCHSGTNTRAIEPPDVPIKERYLPSPWALAGAESGHRNVGRAVRSQLRRSTKVTRKTKDIVNAELPEVLITGCRDTQTSADAFIDNAYTGALTYGLVEAMKKKKGKLTYRELHQAAADALAKKNFEQVPQLEGKKASFDSPVFGGL
jgi:metacaspase-1